MDDNTVDAELLPVLRPDVEFHAGPAEKDGTPTFVIYDPLRATFDRATWAQAQVLQSLRDPMTVDQLRRQLAEHTTVNVSNEDIRRLCADARLRGLTVDSCVAATPPQSKNQNRNPLTILFRNMIYWRIPLVQPDEFLERTVPWVRYFAHPASLLAYALIASLGAALLVQRFDTYLSTFSYFFNLRGLVCFGLTVMVVKICHELSHAYVAKAMGNRVPAMGVALIFLFPVAYSDVTDSWRMQSRRKRSWIALAGVIAELVIAGVALFVWALSPEGIVKSICFVISSTTLISTLVINLNPAMRFDGYYVLSDWVGIDNLQSRASAVTRWAYRRYLLGMDVKSPESGLTPKRLGFMIVYATSTWTYRLFLFTGIAFMMYHRMTKTLGAVLFVALIYTLIAKPLATELASVLKLCLRGSWNLRTKGATVAIALILLWLIVPMRRWHSSPATTVPQGSQVIYTPSDGVIRGLNLSEGQSIRKGQLLFTIESKELASAARIAELELERIRLELGVIKSEQERRAWLPEARKELARARAKLASMRTAIQRNRIVASVDGELVNWDESVRNGVAVGGNQVLGRIVSRGDPTIVGYVRHDFVSDVSPGDRTRFISHARHGRLLGTVTAVAPVHTELLPHAGLSSTFGGDIAAIPNPQGELEVVDSLYEVEVGLDRPNQGIRLEQVGNIWLQTSPRSRLADWGRYISRVLLRESGV